MSAAILGILLPLIRFLELFLNFTRERAKGAETRHAILTLQHYRERLEKALLARGQIRDIPHRDDHPGGVSDDGPQGRADDGYRRD